MFVTWILLVWYFYLTHQGTFPNHAYFSLNNNDCEILKIAQFIRRDQQIEKDEHNQWVKTFSSKSCREQTACMYSNMLQQFFLPPPPNSVDLVRNMFFSSSNSQKRIFVKISPKTQAKSPIVGNHYVFLSFIGLGQTSSCAQSEALHRVDLGILSNRKHNIRECSFRFWTLVMQTPPISIASQ